MATIDLSIDLGFPHAYGMAVRIRFTVVALVVAVLKVSVGDRQAVAHLA